MDKKEPRIPIQNFFHEQIKYSLDTIRYKLQISSENRIFHTDIPWHYHQDFEMAYILQESVLYQSKSQECILKEGDAVFVNANVLHMLHPLSPDGRLRMIIQFFDASLLAGLPGSDLDQKYIRPVLNHTGFELLPLYAQNACHRHVIDLLLQAAKEASTQKPFCDLDIRNIFSEIWKEIYTASFNYPSPAPSGKRKTSYDLLKQAIAFLHQNYAQAITITHLAKNIHVSERECYRVFREGIGMSPNQLLLSIRLQHAAEALAQSTDSVNEIADATGFTSASYLCKCFKSRYGVTPNEYRHQTRPADAF